MSWPIPGTGLGEHPPVTVEEIETVLGSKQAGLFNIDQFSTDTIGWGKQQGSYELATPYSTTGHPIQIDPKAAWNF